MGSEWWSWSGSNRRPPPCKGGAPPAELQPRDLGQGLVGLSGFEPLTSRLSAVRSNQLSYRPGNNRSESNLKVRRVFRRV
jgi:hypothetical protein